MTLGLPIHLVPYHVRRASARAAHTAALVCLLVATLIVLALQSARPGLLLWPALMAFGVMLAALWLLDRRRTAFYCVAYLLLGGISMFWVGVVALSEFPTTTTTDNFVLSMGKAALVMVGGVGLRAVSAISWSAAGLLTAEVATFIAARQTGALYVFDATPIAAFGLFAIVQVGLSATRFRGRIAQPNLHRAARDEHLSAVRYSIELKAAAVMHDTVLNHLAAIANAPDGPLDRALRTLVDRDLEVLVGEEWLLDAAGEADQSTHIDWRNSRLFRVIDECRELGLGVDVSGDLSAISRLGVERSVAVALATKQCLVNVLKHAETDSAEVVVYGSENDVSIMIIDAGKGFSEAETGADRLGLRQSVRRRVEAVGGSVQVWSTPGHGTSVMIRVPATTVAEQH